MSLEKINRSLYVGGTGSVAGCKHESGPAKPRQELAVEALPGIKRTAIDALDVLAVADFHTQTLSRYIQTLGQAVFVRQSYRGHVSYLLLRCRLA